ncbi:ubiquinone biosynthesis regulatory protein kinase UbiB [Alkalimarinus alittae]|uniref:Probable protein kinase UbiB n=1 Tax=Alkalimarinus alittae TaxID=2961619 RepID=A0ABY6N3R5_9ALTE|nr:ubiquinone biosynthesis regulatory protein kinase UbiB [Alkalimarinus alittae]UZE96763.1 ubiquinone biosynthesis regulatory protein kinase UbiB [Alkalimarinus alittae]
MSRIQRLIKIIWVIGKYRLDEFLPLTHLPLPLRLLFMLAPWRLFPKPELPRGARIRYALEELGPIFIKFGQILSTRRDLLPDDIAIELKSLQDNVAPFPGETAQMIVEQALKQSTDDIFLSFDIKPLASASIAQVHAAQLQDGTEVVVKVIRPGITRVIHQDIALMYVVAGLAEKYWEDGKRLHPVEIVSDYEKTIFDELDLQREAANASQLRRNFENSSLIYMPEIFWDYTNTDVLVMERVYGVPVADIDTLNAHGTNLKKLAEKGVDIFFTQVFRDSFFHADMHPGNIFVNVDNPEDPQYIAIDFGIVGSLTPDDQSYLARNLLAFFNRDYRQVAELHISSGWVPEDTPVNEFESAIRTVCEPIFEKPLKDISFGQVLLRLFQTARRFNMEVQPQLVLLQKTLLNIEGLGRQLYPDLDLWTTAQPFLEDWMKQRVGPPGLWKNIKQHIPSWLEQSPEIPQMVYDAINQVKNLDNFSHNQERSIKALKQEMHRRQGINKDYMFAALAFGAAVLSQNAEAVDWLRDLPGQSWLLAGIGLYFLIKRK